MAGDDATDERKVQVVGKRRCVQLVNDVQEFVVVASGISETTRRLHASANQPE